MLRLGICLLRISGDSLVSAVMSTKARAYLRRIVRPLYARRISRRGYAMEWLSGHKFALA